MMHFSLLLFVTTILGSAAVSCAVPTVVTGRVTDVAGRGLQPHDAWLSIDAPDEAGPPGARRAKLVPLRKLEADGTFTFSFEGRYAHLNLRKPGWYAKRVTFLAERAEEDGYNDVRVVMEARPQNVPMLQDHVSLAFSPLGEDDIVDFDLAAPESRWHPKWRGEYKPWKAAVDARREALARNDVTDPSQWPANGVVLLADVDEEGDEVVIINDRTLRGNQRFVRNLRLIMTDGPELAEGGGFLRYVPDAYRRASRHGPDHLPTHIAAADVDTADWAVDDQHHYATRVHAVAHRETYREMDEAPEEGYGPELLLSPQEQSVRYQNGGHGWRLFFYFRTADGRYGKGYFEEMGGGWIDRGRHSITRGEPARLRLRCVLYLNPVPGDRRLDDGRDGWLEKDPERPDDLYSLRPPKPKLTFTRSTPTTQPTTQPNITISPEYRSSRSRHADRVERATTRPTNQPATNTGK